MTERFCRSCCGPMKALLSCFLAGVLVGVCMTGMLLGIIRAIEVACNRADPIPAAVADDPNNRIELKDIEAP